MIQRLACLFLVLIMAAGCAKLRHLDQLLILKDYSEEQDAQKIFVNEAEDRFQELLAAMQNGSLRAYRSQYQVLEQFGAPVLKQSVKEDGLERERWLYRHPIHKTARDKVYLYFDSSRHLVSAKHIVIRMTQ